ncbi:MAG: hypothetical protein ABIP95_09215 [Pelobium sp.]
MIEPENDLDLDKAFLQISKIEQIDESLKNIAAFISRMNLNRFEFDALVKQGKINKEDLLDLLLYYINLILNDHILTEKEKKNVDLLKLLFRIKEGDFFKLRYHDVKEIIYRQLKIIYRNDDRISDSEAIFKVDLQHLFNLIYDQFLHFNEREIRLAIERGAHISVLDTVRFPHKIKHNEEAEGLNIFQEIKDKVWERDGGACLNCNSTKNIGFFPIIPFEQGGSATYRNMHLLCLKFAG